MEVRGAAGGRKGGWGGRAGHCRALRTRAPVHTCRCGRGPLAPLTAPDRPCVASAWLALLAGCASPARSCRARPAQHLLDEARLQYAHFLRLHGQVGASRKGPHAGGCSTRGAPHASWAALGESDRRHNGRAGHRPRLRACDWAHQAKRRLAEGFAGQHGRPAPLAPQSSSRAGALQRRLRRAGSALAAVRAEAGRDAVRRQLAEEVRGGAARQGCPAADPGCRPPLAVQGSRRRAWPTAALRAHRAPLPRLPRPDLACAPRRAFVPSPRAAYLASTHHPRPAASRPPPRARRRRALGGCLRSCTLGPRRTSWGRRCGWGGGAGGPCGCGGDRS
jgi:hypothetical protein